MNDRDECGVWLWGADGEVVALACAASRSDGPDFRSHEEVVANARLIAAAPTMLQALELAADTFRDFSNVLKVLRKETLSAAADVAEQHIRETLAKALRGAVQEPPQ